MELTKYRNIYIARRDGYVSLSDAARLLGCSRQNVHQYLRHRRDWPEVRAWYLYRGGWHALYSKSEVLTWSNTRSKKNLPIAS